MKILKSVQLTKQGEPMKDRSAAILVRQGKLLLIHRQKGEKDYYVLPGGSIEAGETPEAACIREVREETALQVNIQEKLRVFTNGTRREFYFRVNYLSGRIKLGGPEKERNSEQNSYKPTWVKLSNLHKIPLLPEEIVPVIQSLH